ncbi:MAG: fumarylacetoacetate hydrolase family protein [Rhodospirillaceae bacterium]|jgi:2-keto-4-pentenoate hydratase/2-oxohepta-3-ene-1,7-dioic acid hydratase in catechol pathway|nr:fumarylacetoacetate hydrolase family protein [Rhodospirillaceae bacterium]MBT4488966.1 fumarylacetoacetate hydrolase family protein [Rhodospirillaceae bacterium]MBT5192752.1 fumarylacetoacetate hydrolase family protein [Rhodospirillaceae bacterium]MBT5896957.1 fumarylacetoacetate hydrolase family protein [Rhodospirillaceae bacterium]MBT6427289.1 fumarylacetoacetate hydrolase family protein [Rhodospirillaceae bacterium]
MKLLSFSTAAGDSYGIVQGDGVIDLGRRLGSKYPDLRSLLEGNGQAEAAALAGEAPDHSLDAITYLQVIPNARRIICIGLNYREHAEEMGLDFPENPSLFSKWPDALVGHEQDVVRPKASTHYDFEGELAFIISKPGRHISTAAAMDHVAGYCPFLDGSVRDFQGQSVIAGKNFQHSGSCGPWMTTADEIADPMNLQLTTRLNGDVVQNESTEQLFYTVPDIIAYVSQFTPLHPGDVIATGTPSGVGAGRKPPLWMQPGDRIEIEISGLGCLANNVVAE